MIRSDSFILNTSLSIPVTVTYFADSGRPGIVPLVLSMDVSVVVVVVVEEEGAAFPSLLVLS